MDTTKRSPKYNALWLTSAAVFMAMNVAVSSFGIPVPGGHFYLCDVIICTAAILLDPLAAFMVGGVGSFLGDLFFYPAPMFVSLATHGLQAVVISLCAHRLFRNKPVWGAVVGVLLGAVIMVAGYTLGRTFVYSTWEAAVMKMPYEVLQAGIGAVAGVILTYKCGLKRLFQTKILKNIK